MRPPSMFPLSATPEADKGQYEGGSGRGSQAPFRITSCKESLVRPIGGRWAAALVSETSASGNVDHGEMHCGCTCIRSSNSATDSPRGGAGMTTQLVKLLTHRLQNGHCSDKPKPELGDAERLGLGESSKKTKKIRNTTSCRDRARGVPGGSPPGSQAARFGKRLRASPRRCTRFGKR